MDTCVRVRFSVSNRTKGSPERKTRGLKQQQIVFQIHSPKAQMCSLADGATHSCNLSQVKELVLQVNLASGLEDIEARAVALHCNIAVGAGEGSTMGPKATNGHSRARGLDGANGNLPGTATDGHFGSSCRQVLGAASHAVLDSAHHGSRSRVVTDLNVQVADHPVALHSRSRGCFAELDVCAPGAAGRRDGEEQARAAIGLDLVLTVEVAGDCWRRRRRRHWHRRRRRRRHWHRRGRGRRHGHWRRGRRRAGVVGDRAAK
jgi:hypothetical protein